MTFLRTCPAAVALVLAMSGAGTELHATSCALPARVDLAGADAVLVAAWTRRSDGSGPRQLRERPPISMRSTAPCSIRQPRAQAGATPLGHVILARPFCSHFCAATSLEEGCRFTAYGSPGHASTRTST